MRKLIVFILALIFSQNTVFAGGLQASFTGSPNSPCDVTCDQYSVACYDGEVDGSGNLLDKSGCNLSVQSEDFGTTWTTTRASIVTNQAKNPVDGALTADALVEDGTAADTHFTQQPGVPLVLGTTYVVSTYIKPGLRKWVAVYITVENTGYYFNLENVGAIGNPLGPAFSPKIIRVTEDWYRVSFAFTATATASRSLQFYAGEGNADINFDGLSTTSLYLFGAQVREQRNVTDTNPGRYIATVAANKPWHDLAPNNAPGRAVTSLQGSDGNRLVGRSLNGTDQWYSKVSHDSLNILDGDNTFTQVLRSDNTAVGSLFAWSKGAFQANGGYFFNNHGANSRLYRLNKAGSTCDAAVGVTDSSDDKYHIIQGIRRSSLIQICADGVCGTPVNCASFGIDGASNFTIGASSGGTTWEDGAVYYFHHQRRALSPHELSAQRENLLGILSSDKTVGATNVIVDGDMEAVGTAVWVPGNNATLSKTTANIHQGSQSLRIAYNGTNNPLCTQNILTTTRKNLVTGFCRGNGAAIPRIQNGTTTYDTICTSATNWQSFSVIMETGNGQFYLQCVTAIAGWCEFDDIYVYEYDDAIWDFSRSTTAFQTFSDGTIAEVAASIPRVGGKGGGILVEGQSTVLNGLTEAFDSWANPVGGCAVTADDAVAPDGSMTADLLDNTGGANNDYRRVESANLGDLTGEDYTYSVYARADTPHIGTIVLTETGVSSTSENIALTAEWQRFDVTRTCVGGGTGTIRIEAYPGENGVATGIAHYWGANLTETTFPVSYIKNAGAGTTQVTRTADSMMIDPYPDVGNKILSDKFDEDGVLTFEFDAKCEWGGSSDIGEQRYYFTLGNCTDGLNRVTSYVSATGRLNGFSLYSAAGVQTYGYSLVDPVDFSEWHTVKARIDFGDLSRCTMWINGSDAGITYVNNIGTAVFDGTLNDPKLYLGADRCETPNIYCNIKNFRILPREF